MDLPLHKRLRQYRELLETRPRRLTEMADVAGVSVRTAVRDLKIACREWGWHLSYDASTRTRTAHGTLTIPALSLNDKEALALLVAEPALRGYGGGPFAPAMRTALEKIRGALDVPIPDSVPQVGFELHCVRETDPDLLRRFIRAMNQCETLEMTYFTPSRQETTTRRVDPYEIYNYEGGWYTAAYCHLREEVRDFAISSHRIKQLVETGTFFQRDPAFDPKIYRSGSFGQFKGGSVREIRLRFHTEQAIYQQERVRLDEEIREPQVDGSLVIRFPAPVNIGLVRWVLQYGSEVEVQAPEELRAWVRAEVKKMGMTYGAGPGAGPGASPGTPPGTSPGTPIS